MPPPFHPALRRTNSGRWSEKIAAQSTAVWVDKSLTGSERGHSVAPESPRISSPPPPPSRRRRRQDVAKILTGLLCLGLKYVYMQSEMNLSLDTIISAEEMEAAHLRDLTVDHLSTAAATHNATFTVTTTVDKIINRLIDHTHPPPQPPQQQPALSFYTPSLYDAPSVTADRSMLHIVKTRFMQYQPHLRHLGGARVELFRTFCLPTMVHQTSDNFLWLIWTDPDLDPDLLRAMVEMIRPYPHIYLVASLNKDSWRGGQAQNLTQTRVYAGNQTTLEMAMALRDTLPVLETRLDADDGLHVQYLAHIQEQALGVFGTDGFWWKYWCAGAELSWRWTTEDAGSLRGKKYYSFCPTPGLTVGFQVGTAPEDVYSRRHSVLYERLQIKEGDFCGKGRPGPDCVEVVTEFPYPVLRARTPTSASMIGTLSDDSTPEATSSSSNDENTSWNLLEADFMIRLDDIKASSRYIADNMLQIAREGLQGQCTTGHSCTVSQPLSSLYRLFLEILLWLTTISSLTLLPLPDCRTMPRRNWRLSLRTW